MQTSLKALRRPSHDILFYASFLHPVLLKTYHINCLEIQILTYLELEQDYVFYQIANWEWPIIKIKGTLYKNLKFKWK